MDESDVKPDLNASTSNNQTKTERQRSQEKMTNKLRKILDSDTNYVGTEGLVFVDEAMGRIQDCDIHKYNDPKELNRDAALIQTMGRVLLKKVTEISRSNTLKKLDAKLFATKLKHLGQQKHEEFENVNRVQNINPLMVDDEERENPDDVFPDDYNLENNEISGVEWSCIGRSVKRYLGSVPRMSLLNPVFNVYAPVAPTEMKVKRERAKIDQTKAPLVVISAKDQAEHANNEMSVSKELVYIRQCLFKQFRKAKNNGEAVCYYRFVIDPTSFSQTIENMFHLSVLINDGTVSLLIGDGELPVLKPPSTETLSDAVKAEESEKKQAVMAFDFKTYKGFIELLNIKEATIKH